MSPLLFLAFVCLIQSIVLVYDLYRHTQTLNLLLEAIILLQQRGILLDATIEELKRVVEENKKP